MNAWLNQLCAQTPACLEDWADRIRRDPALRCSLQAARQAALDAARPMGPETLARVALHLKLLRWFLEGQPSPAQPSEGLRRLAAAVSRLLWPGELLELLDLDVVGQLRERLDAYSYGGPAEYYFQEWIATACDPARRRSLGAYYTPMPIVRCIVDRIGQLLPQCDEPTTLVLDPCCGSGLFLTEAAERWGRAVIAGVECDPASAMSAAVLLANRTQLRCANSLDLRAEQLRQSFASANGLERLVILGNPPYANFGRRNQFPWLERLLRDYKQGLSEKKLNLNDDYIKFLRWSQHQVDEVGVGAVAFVLNNSFLESITRRMLRWSLLQSFDRIEVIDLHGGVGKGETAGAQPDENVFGIRQGVVILVLLKRQRGALGDAEASGRVFHRSIRGTRQQKMESLATLSDSGWTEFTPSEPSFLFSPTTNEDETLRGAAAGRPKPASTIDRAVVHYGSGVQTKCDRLFVDICPQTLGARMRDWLGGNRVEVLPSVPEWLQRRRSAATFQAELIRPYMTAPLDVRYVYFDPDLLGRARLAVMQHMLGESARGLVFMRQSTNPGSYDHFLAVSCLVSDRVFHSGHGAPFLTPFKTLSGRGNVQAAWLDEHWRDAQELPLDGSDACFWPYYYALFHSTSYRKGFHQDLRTHFPPLPPKLRGNDFRSMVELGRRLISAHLKGAQSAGDKLERQDGESSAAVGAISPIEARPVYDSAGGVIRVHSSAFIPAPAGVLDWRIGGYRVIHRWLTQRRGRPFDASCQAELELRIQCFETTMEIVAEIDSICNRNLADD